MNRKPSEEKSSPTRQVRNYLLLALCLFCIVIHPFVKVSDQFIQKNYTIDSAPKHSIPITEQPFYSFLQESEDQFEKGTLTRVISTTPGRTVANFYTAMSHVGQYADMTIKGAKPSRGLIWNKEQRNNTAYAESLLEAASNALDASSFPLATRKRMAKEAAIELKQILDYVFTYSEIKFDLLDSNKLPSKNWNIPGTPIYLTEVLTSSKSKSIHKGDYKFSAETVKNIERLHKITKGMETKANPYATPMFYKHVYSTPGGILPPKAYALLPESIRARLETNILGLSLIQVITTSALFIFLFFAISTFRRLLLKTYEGIEELTFEASGRLYVRRLLLSFPAIVISRISSYILADYIHLKGNTLIIIISALKAIHYLALAYFFLCLFEILGHILSNSIVSIKRKNSTLELLRAKNLIMPLCRLMGVLVGLIFLYVFLVQIGIPSKTVFAFSAVPGLALGLGASKLLSNMFSGLAIQADRPIRIGEFCKFGDDLGFITKIGLRSIELKTLESIVSIPNSIADQIQIINYSSEGKGITTYSSTINHGLNLQLKISTELSSVQLEQLLKKSHAHMESIGSVRDPIATIDQPNAKELTLTCVAYLPTKDWGSYLNRRERLIIRLNEIIWEVINSRISIIIPRTTRLEQLKRVPILIRESTESEPYFKLIECSNTSATERGYYFSITLDSTHDTHQSFKKGINDLAQAIESILKENEIIIKKRS